MIVVFAIKDKYLEIAGQLPGYEPRPIQEAMVTRAYEALQTQKTVVIEAGTGAGKSFGYLIPALISHHRPIVISTGTIALQEQLMEKDIPFVAKAAGMEDLKIKLVKGRRNYLCIQKMQEFEKTLGRDASERLYLNVLKSAFQAGWDGDRASLDMEIPREIWEEIQSDSEDCLGKKCTYYNENPYRQAREDLNEADILVVNHALYLQDLISGQALLPPHEVVIVDEAHHFKSFALRAFTARIGKFATHKLLRKIHRRLEPVPEDFQHAIYQTEAEILQWLFRVEKPTFKIYPDDRFLQLIAQQIMVLTELRNWLSCYNIAQMTLLETELDKDRASVQREKLLAQLDNLTGRWEFFLEDSGLDRVNWAEVSTERLYYEIKSTPLNISEQLTNALWNEKSGVLTSATLSTNQNLVNFRKDLGIPVTPDSQDLILESPFQFLTQCDLYLPQGMPDPNDEMFQPAVIAEIVKLLLHSNGRAFVLFTSYAAMQRVSAAVIPQVPFPCKMQGDMPKNRLIEWFKTSTNSVLFATATFWEGIDIPGEALSCVIIDRIPFSTPDEPVHSAMIDRLKRLGEDWFNGYVLPEATIRLKQGFGRLIRSKTDRGIVAILDPRLRTKGYGQKIVRSLPKARVINTLDDSRALRESISLPRA
jgi:ATP-dependent DNA helicase DinG